MSKFYGSGIHSLFDADQLILITCSLIREDLLPGERRYLLIKVENICLGCCEEEGVHTAEVAAKLSPGSHGKGTV